MTSNSYLMNSYRGSRELYKFLWSISESIPIKGTEMEVLKARKLYHRFITHLYVCSCLRSMQNKGFDKRITVPIPSPLIWEKLKRKVKTTYLQDLGIIRFTNHFHSSYGQGKCREYRLNINIFSKAQRIDAKYIRLAWKSLIEGSKLPQDVNIFTGRPLVTPRKHKMFIWFNNKQDFEIPEIIKKSLKCLEPCPYNPHDIIPWLDRAELNFKKLKKKYMMIKTKLNIKYPDMKHSDYLEFPQYRDAYQKHNKGQGLFINMKLALNTIKNQNPKPIDIYTEDGKQLMQYMAAYMPQDSGRVTEIHGGFQSLTTPCKLLLLKGVPNIYNLDLKNSQAVILADELRKGGRPCTWLEKYITSERMKERLAKTIGISVACWKECFYSVIMGAGSGNFGAVFKSIRKEIKDYEKAVTVRNNFIQEIQPMLTACDEWREYLLRTTSERYTSKYNQYHWINACGMKFRDYVKTTNPLEVISTITGEVMTKRKDLDKLKRELAAFFLQGREAFFIHNLTIVCKENAIPVYKNEHDGIITGKKIPEYLIQEVAREVKLPKLKLEIKPICSEAKWEMFHNYLLPNQ